MINQTKTNKFPLIKIIKSIFGSDEFSMLFSQIAQTSSEVFPNYISGVISKKEDSFYINSVSNAKDWIHFPIKLVKHPQNLTTDCFFKKCTLEIPEVGTHKLVFFPIETASQQKANLEAWFFIDEKFMNEFQKDDVFLFVEILREATQKIIKIEKIKELTIIDDVTGLFNTRHLFSILEQTIIQADRYHSEFSLIFFDIDHFKSVNDTYGHLIGSKLLKLVGIETKKMLRKADLAFRYGGDEFVVFLPNTSKKNSTHVVKRLWQHLREHTFVVDNVVLNLTGSFGSSTFPDDAKTMKEIIEIADNAMYDVKKKSRDNYKISGV